MKPDCFSAAEPFDVEVAGTDGRERFPRPHGFHPVLRRDDDRHVGAVRVLDLDLVDLALPLFERGDRVPASKQEVPGVEAQLRVAHLEYAL